ncbi:LysM peptidoglycan-binding domain-containing protein [Candidatus Dojkabacteria bacterium]|nr:LysM peptidoglycan-binding domain-containing protein [Candidatus Dojkabacteria bacterium]
MAKKRKRGSKKTKFKGSNPAHLQKESPEVNKNEEVHKEKKKNIFSSIYNLSIGKLRIVAFLLVIIGLILIFLGGASLYNAVKTQIDDKTMEEEKSDGEINSGIQTTESENIAEKAQDDDRNENVDSNENENKEERMKENGSESDEKNEESDSADNRILETQEVSEGAKMARLASASKAARTGKWVATDYKPGDISSGNYEVQSGDTLWEISEAVYGSGFQWHKILDVNSSSVGFLPNGSQALIVPGQVLIIP